MPTWGEVAQIITSLAAFLAAGGALLVSIRTSRKVEQVHIATNSLTDRLVKSTDAEAHARGLQEGRQEKMK